MTSVDEARGKGGTVEMEKKVEEGKIDKEVI